MGWFEVTAPPGHIVPLNAAMCERVRPADANAPRGACAAIDLASGGVQHARETTEAVMTLIRKAGA